MSDTPNLLFGLEKSRQENSMKWGLSFPCVNDVK